jgi:hypothetical protein
MRIALVLVSLCLVLALGALGLFLTLSPRPEPADDLASLRDVPIPSTGGVEADDRDDAILLRIDALDREVEDLHAEIAALRAGAAREVLPATGASGEPADEGRASYVALHRDAILQVIDDDRRDQQRKREEEQRARDLQAMLARAERTAKRFGLTGDQQKALADVYLIERQKMEELRTQMRDQGGPGSDPEQVRESFQQLREWRLGELTTRLGADLAQQINDSEFDRMRGLGQGGRRGNRGQDGEGNDGNPPPPPGGGF